MILIVTNETDDSTVDIIDWLVSKGNSPVRVSGERLLEQLLSIEIQDKGQVVFKIWDDRTNRVVDSRDVKSVWYRRWARPLGLEVDDKPSSLSYQFVRHTQAQFNTLTTMFFEALSHCQWLNAPSDLSLSKLSVLSKAAHVGFKIPDTIICSNKVSLINFLSKHGRIIAKSIGDVTFFSERDRTLGIYTREITEGDLKHIGETFFPTILQEMVHKQYELRVFFLDSVCYSMAIFSQQNSKTKVDYRKYDHIIPNRRVPHHLPPKVQDKILRLMKELQLKCGSLDLIKDADGNFVFLEVNPVGQFGMTSVPCNYNLEELIADRLIDMNS